jgi:hypothetical protein
LVSLAPLGTMCMYRLIAALSAVSPWLGLEPCKVGGIVRPKT